MVRLNCTIWYVFVIIIVFCMSYTCVLLCRFSFSKTFSAPFSEYIPPLAAALCNQILGIFDSEYMAFGVAGGLGPSWGHLGAILGPSWGYLGPLGATLGPLGAFLGPSWGLLGPSRWPKAEIAKTLKNKLVKSMFLGLRSSIWRDRRGFRGVAGATCSLQWS